VTKKPWIKPELIVLVRGKPEEAVLQGCKNADVGGGNWVTNVGCTQPGCADCETGGTS
jgi:hypothetical protein